MLFKLGLCGQSVKFNPFNPTRLAVCLAQNFAIVGNGRMLILDFKPSQGPMLQNSQAQFIPVAHFVTQDALLDCSWNEQQENLVVAGCGDGSIKLYDVGLGSPNNPVKVLKEHTGEVQSVSFNIKNNSLFLSGSWDQSIKLWDINQSQSMRSYQKAHDYCIYQTIWNPRNPSIFMSASGDLHTKIWDIRQQLPTISVRTHEMEVLCADWCKYDDSYIVTGSVDKSVRVWDIRQMNRPLEQMLGHTYAVRKVAFSTFQRSQILSCSYDMTVRIWDHAQPENALLRVWDHHTEFVQGIDWSSLEPGLVASVSWDESLYLWHIDRDPTS